MILSHMQYQSTFQGILTRNPDADYNYEVTSSDIEEGINASREIIGSFRDNPVFSVVDQLTMAASVNYYFNEGWNSNELTAGSNALSELAFRALITRGNIPYMLDVYTAERQVWQPLIGLVEISSQLSSPTKTQCNQLV